MSEQSPGRQRPAAVQTTGHAWDGDLQEYNNPLPRWWLWSFYATVVFAVLYWLLYPAWPVGESWTRGLKSISYQVDGEERSTHWNTRNRLIHQLQEGRDATRQREYLEKVAGQSFEDILADADMAAFTRAAGEKLFGDNCAACHGRGGQGKMGLFPSLVDDAWLWGGTPEQIYETLVNGRNGYMPAFEAVLSEQQLDDVASYVLSLSGEAPEDEAAGRGEEIFQTATGACWQCHGKDARGRAELGSANLTDRIWTIVDVAGQPDLQARKALIASFVSGGLLGQRVMPGWKERLSDAEIKVLALYTHQLGAR